MDEATSPGLVALVKRLGDLAVSMVRTRVELFAVELEEEKCRLIQAVLLTAAAIALGVTALTLITITIVIVCWENGRVPALCVLSAIFVFATLIVLRFLKKILAAGPGFSGTVRELEKDRVCFQSRD